MKQLCFILNLWVKRSSNISCKHSYLLLMHNVEAFTQAGELKTGRYGFKKKKHLSSRFGILKYKFPVKSHAMSMCVHVCMHACAERTPAIGFRFIRDRRVPCQASKEVFKHCLLTVQ